MNVPEADYFSNPGYSQSDMKQALESPELLHWMKHEGRRSNGNQPQMLEGKLAHSFILEHKFNKPTRCAAHATPRRKGRGQGSRRKRQQPITLAQYEKALGMNHAVSGNLLCNSFFVDGLLSSPSSVKTTEQLCP